MNKKTIIAVMSGALAAGLVCLIIGLIVYFTANGNIISLITGLFTTAGGNNCFRCGGNRIDYYGNDIFNFKIQK